MSQILPSVDLSSYTIGQSGLISLDTVKSKFPSDITKATQDAHIRLYNESGWVLQVWTDTGDTNEYCPAGAWLTLIIDQASNEIHFTIVNQMSNPPIQLLLPVYYKQGEDVPEMAQLGNSPVGGAVSTTGGTPGVANQLINTGNAGSTNPVIQIAEAGATGNQMFADNQGNLQISQYFASVLTTLFRVIAAASVSTDNVLISDAQHRAHILGVLICDLAVLFAGNTNNTSIQGAAAGTAHLVAGLGTPGNTGYATQSQIGDSNFTSFLAGHTGQGAPANSFGFYASGDMVSGFHSIQNSGVPFVPNNALYATANGSVAGSLQLRIAVWGNSLKIAWVYLAGLNTASNVTVVFPGQISSAVIYPGDIGGSTTGQLFNGGSPVNCRQGVYATTGGTAGSSSSQTNFRSQGFYTGLGFDRITINTTGAAAINNGILIVGH